MATTPSLSPSPSLGVGPPPGTIKLEDLHLPPFEELSQTPEPTQTPAEADKALTSPKPGKKRKSWGQKLPEPKTNLPPRKRAKTQDEKEQRRIERIKRNRLAAHNSRERKRVEVEELQQKNEALEEQVRSMRETMARMTEELAGLRSRVLRGPSAHPKVEPPSSLADLGRKPPTIGPCQAMSPPESTLGSFDIPSEAPTQPSTPLGNNLIDVASAEPVQTQHSAAMLWDLQFGLFDFVNLPADDPEQQPHYNDATPWYTLTTNSFSDYELFEQSTSNSIDMHALSGAAAFPAVSDEYGNAVDYFEQDA
ncbi:transcription factor that binds to CRE motif [Coniosporium apollinis]|uniref:Transcription factor that binds to CRE motif n=2 Tax=Coniosporium TaxID=2810619 RepID=A0ABQ9NRU1_9PEZI|nr:transcription factor that binds to CRE motif [Cladosporium sp. JES 115]KAJ9662234.1 transcription factor that binds to CRE motif [Coniosporium apollinis]